MDEEGGFKMNARRFIFAYTLLLCAVVGIEASGERNPDDAKFIKQSVPQTMVTGKEYEVSITMKNTGKSTWTPEAFGLTSLNPPDNDTWGETGISFQNITSEVPPDASVTFKRKVRAPTQPDTYNFQWKMSHYHVAGFGDLTHNVQVKVSAPKR